MNINLVFIGTINNFETFPYPKKGTKTRQELKKKIIDNELKKEEDKKY